jgi:hypothetical protein
MLHSLIQNPILGQSLEYNDNRISLFIGQYGKCGVTGRLLQIGQMDCHHKTPKRLGGTDKYSNLLLVDRDVHELIHASENETIAAYLGKLSLRKNSLSKLNHLRILVGNREI